VQDVKLYREGRKNWIFAGHNLKEFDIPFLYRRLIVNGNAIPSSWISKTESLGKPIWWIHFNTGALETIKTTLLFNYWLPCQIYLPQKMI
jgi:hypothetical protein